MYIMYITGSQCDTLFKIEVIQLGICRFAREYYLSVLSVIFMHFVLPLSQYGGEGGLAGAREGTS